MYRPLPFAAAARFAFWNAVLLAFVACGRGSGEQQSSAAPASSERAAGSAAGAPAAAEPTPDMCRLLPTEDVARILQDSAGLRVASAAGSAGGGCTYRSAPDDTGSVRMLVEVSRPRNSTEASAAVAAARAMHAERNMPVTDAPDLGAGAFLSREGLTASATYQVGPYQGRVNLSAGETVALDRVAAAGRAVAAEARRRLEGAR
jgi:hypothetical protein